MSKFDVIISYGLLTALALLIAFFVAALGLPNAFSLFLCFLLGWSWSDIYPWLDNKMKEFIRKWMM